jgi:pimeloyl-ACP methyl ester carboxylesterase
MRPTQEFKIDSDRYRSLDIPVLFLLGSESSQYLKAGVEAFDAMLPESRIEILQGQGHFAMVTAPELFVQEIIEFVNSPWQGGKNE